MTDGDLARIERELNISLPESYRRVVTQFPIPAYVGNSEVGLFDDADALIRLNRELREGDRGRGWPEHLFAVGSYESDLYAMDLRTPAARTFWVDRVLDEQDATATGLPFDEWCAQFVADLRIDLEADGHDADGPPAARQRLEARNARGELGCLLWPIGIAALVFGGLLVYAYLRSR